MIQNRFLGAVGLAKLLHNPVAAGHTLQMASPDVLRVCGYSSNTTDISGAVGHGRMPNGDEIREKIA